MSGTFSSLSSALSGLRYNRVAMDVASGNVANAGTEGYARRQVIGQATGAPAAPAMWSRWATAGGDGVEPGAITRMVDPLLDSRARTEHAGLSYHDTRSASLVRFETTLGEPGENGVSAALSAFKAGWHDVANNPGDLAARSQLLARAETLAGAIRAQDRAITTEWGDQRTRLDAQAAEVNQVTGQLAELNKGLRNAHVAGTDAGVLLDQRDQLTMRLAELTGSTTKVMDDSTVQVQLQGRLLVDGGTPYALTVTGNEEMGGSAGPVTVTLTGPAVTPAVATPLGGEMGGSYKVLTDDLPDYRSNLDKFAAALAAQVNTQQGAGQDLTSTQGVAMFSGTTAKTLTVAFDDPQLVAAAKLGAGVLDNTNAAATAGLDMGAKSYRELITKFGVSVSTSKQAAANQGVMAAQVDGSREALSGISIDEEMVNLLAAQRGYEGAARVLTAMDSMLDTLINRTGLR